ncbi:MAG: hypothetical protein R8M70_03010 [Alphaproteobacteria bacterium]|nr:hypothetical protein [Alphaproteobacteria bacterium]
MYDRIIFDAKHFLLEVEKIKKFWLHPKYNRLRIEAHKDTQTAEFYSINKSTGLETAVKIPVRVREDTTIYIKTVGEFLDIVQLLHLANVEDSGSLMLVLEKNFGYKKRFNIRVFLPMRDIIGSFDPIP